jgi:Serine/threonine protein phosphatase
MTNKNLFQNVRGKASASRGLIFQRRPSASSAAPSSSFISVRTQKQIPKAVLDFFRKDPRTGESFHAEDKLFHAQVAMHEIDEGCRLLSRAGRHEDARYLSRFAKRMHFSQRIELLRLRLDEAKVHELDAERVGNAHKLRNNQAGAVQLKLGAHPVAAITQAGIGYKNRNEDACLLMSAKRVIALADGMGGHVGGDIASGIAIDFFEHAVAQGEAIDEAIAFANRAILARTRADERLGGMHPMGCTFAAVQLQGKLLKIAHVGDTKVLLMRNHRIHFQTQDHTQGQQLLMEGLVDIPTAFELNHILNRCLGMDVMRVQRDVSVTSLMLEAGDRVLIATDGLTDNFFNSRFRLDELETAFNGGSVMQSATTLMENCLSRMNKAVLPDGRPAKCDNVTLAMMEFAG